ncbi:MAG: tRNA guanosine(34) transglycosylase Tgt [Bacteroidetes bacterium]|nr:tRNA guanosine(34) transglycosylase Tgt [Bacteroidota bacterium]
MAEAPFFELQATCPLTGARAGLLHTAHGSISTPIFMPVGTQGTVKALTQAQLHELEAQVILGNTYHLYLRPGLQVLEAAEGLHRLMGWNRPILTDSGGYQVYSLAANRKISEEGVGFKSHIDGSKHFFTPKNVVDKQRSIGSDILMVLDECPPAQSERGYLLRSLALTHRWAAEARHYFLQQPETYGYRQHQFGIVQGGVLADLRRQSAQAIVDLNFEGNAIGGLSVGEPTEEMYEMTEVVTALLPTHKPRYLMGVGTPANILQSIALGVDMMDCVLPSRNARHGLLYYWDGIRNLKNRQYEQDFAPLDATSQLPADAYSRAYVRHLFKAQEYLALTLATAHNLHFYLRLVGEARRHILAGSFAGWYRSALAQLEQRH